MFCAVCQHPNHPRQETVYLDVPGLRVKVGGESVPYAPCIEWYSNGEVDVGVCDAGYAGSSYGEPEVELQS